MIAILLMIFGRLPAVDDYYIATNIFEGLSFDVFALALLIPYYINYPKYILYPLSYINHSDEQINSTKHKENDLLFLVIGIFGFLSLKLLQFIAEINKLTLISHIVTVYILLGILFIITILLLFSHRIYNITSIARYSPLHPKYIKKLISTKTVAFLGDSLTHGTMSYDWVSDFHKISRTNVINSSFNGNTSFDLLKQVEGVIPLNPNYAVILCGTNDVLSVTTTGFQYNQAVDKNTYFDNMKEVIKKLVNIRVKVIIVSIPPVLEDLDNNINIMINEYNKVLKELTKENDCIYIPFHETLVGILKMIQKETQIQSKEPIEIEMTEIQIEENQFTQKYFYLFKKNINVPSPPLDSLNFLWFIVKQFYIQYLLLEKSFDEISYETGLVLTYDGIHLHSKSAKVLLELISNEITW